MTSAERNTLNFLFFFGILFWQAYKSMECVLGKAKTCFHVPTRGWIFQHIFAGSSFG